MTVALSAIVALGALVPCAHTFSGVPSLSRPTRSVEWTKRRVNMFERPYGAPRIEPPRRWRPQQQTRSVLMGTEEVGGV